jgi:hypothetical protein
MTRCERCHPPLLLVVAFLAGAGLLSAQESWQGSAAVIRSGVFTEPGLFAASNSFPLNTPIIVENLQTGEQVRVTVRMRIESEQKIFLLLSQQAAQRIHLAGSELIRVRARLATASDLATVEPTAEQPYSQDPDLNPAASLEARGLPAQPQPAQGSPEAEAQAEPGAPEAPLEPPGSAEVPAPELGEAAEVAEAPKPPPEAEQPPASGAAPQQAPLAGTARAAAAPAGSAAEQRRLEELTQRIPQKELFLPPWKPEVLAQAAPPEEAPEEEAPLPEGAEELSAPEQPAVSEETAAESAEVGEQAVEETPQEGELAEAEQPPPATEAPLAGTGLAQEPRASLAVPEEQESSVEVALPGPQEMEPEASVARASTPPSAAEAEPGTPSPPEQAQPAPEEEEPPQVARAGEAAQTPSPEEPTPQAPAPAETAARPVAPPEPAAVARAAQPPAPEPGEMALTESLPARSYFLQLGAYSTRGLAENLARELVRTYAVAILPVASGSRLIYKVLVGPLNRDESGTLLYQFRARGFRDAFIKYVE